MPAQAYSFAQAIVAGSVTGSRWLGPYPYTMPLFQWLTALPFVAFGKAGDDRLRIDARRTRRRQLRAGLLDGAIT